MPQFLLVLRDIPSRDWAAEELQSVITRYRAWFDDLRKSDHFVVAHKLRDQEGRVLRRNGSGVGVMDGPYAESKEVLGGFFVVNAGTYDEAVAMTKGCPHFDYGSIEVRMIEDMPRQ